MSQKRSSDSDDPQPGAAPYAPTESPPPGDSAPQAGESPDAGAEGAARDRHASRQAAAALAPGFDCEARYAPAGLLGRGGMADVSLCSDSRIGREVAIKTMRPDVASDPALEQRFLREARLQGQLEHPAIVPVHDLGRATDGSPYFTMKRLRGRTLEAVLGDLRAGDPEAETAFPTRRLWGAFSRICEAVEFAHARGVVHRDLKPGNVVLGDYGEVYVLDWGVAKIDGAPEAASGTSAGEGKDTEIGAVLGTPAYMAPEQERGEAVDARADVYALGAILYEILHLEPLHPERLGDALALPDRRPEVPPELEALCRAMTAERPADRPQRADEVRAAIDGYMAGARDEERRRELADAHAESAARAAESGDRRPAMREAGRALALAPEHPAALATLMRLVMEPPEELPPEVERAVAEESEPLLRGQARRGAIAASAALAAAVPLFLWMGVRDWPLFVIAMVALCANNVSWFVFAYSRIRSEAAIIAGAVLTGVTILALSRLFGPFFVVPAAAVTTTLAYLLQPAVRRHGVFIAIGCASIAVPVLFELVGTWRSSYTFSGNAMAVEPNVVAFPETATLVFLLVWSLGLLAVSGSIITIFRRALTRAERKLHFQAWQLRQLVPDEALPASDAAQR